MSTPFTSTATRLRRCALCQRTDRFKIIQRLSTLFVCTSSSWTIKHVCDTSSLIIINPLHTHSLSLDSLRGRSSCVEGNDAVCCCSSSSDALSNALTRFFHDRKPLPLRERGESASLSVLVVNSRNEFDLFFQLRSWPVVGW